MAQEGSFRSARAGARADPDGRPADLTDGASRMDGAPREPPLSTEGVAVEAALRGWENPRCEFDRLELAAALKRAAEREREGGVCERGIDATVRDKHLPYGGNCHDCSRALSPKEIADGRGGRFCPKCMARPLCDSCHEGHWDTGTYGTSCFYASGHFAQREAHARASARASERSRERRARERASERARARSRARALALAAQRSEHSRSEHEHSRFEHEVERSEHVVERLGMEQ